jgi:hypothetical protein
MNRHPEVLNWLRVMRGSVFMFWLLWLVFVVSGVQ